MPRFARSHSIRFPSRVNAAASLALAAGLATPAVAIDKSWNANTGTWSVAGNWSPIGVPASTDVVRMGNLINVDNNTVWLDQDDSVAGLEISDGMTFRNDGFNFYVSGNTLVTGQNIVNGQGGPIPWPSTLRISHEGLGADFFTEGLAVSDGAVLVLNSGFVEASDTVIIGEDSELRGVGTIEVAGDDTLFINGGTIVPSVGTLTLTQTDAGEFDLDGPNGHGVINLGTTGGAQLTVDGPGLYDAYSGDIHMNADARLHMSITGGWEADQGSLLTVSGTPAGGPARITGTALDFGGDINIIGTDGHLNIESAVTFQSTVAANIGGRIDVLGAAVVNDGAEFTLADDARLAFDGPTEINGGTFDTFSPLFTQGHVSFDGGTEWAGDVTINGMARQLGNVLVSDTTEITADTFDMDGLENAVWSVIKPLTLNVGDLETAGSIFNGMLNISGALVGGGHVTVNLQDPDESWTMAGQMNLTGHALYATRLSGSPVRVSGEFIVNSGNVNILAPATFVNTAEIVIPANSNVRFFGGTSFDDDATFFGDGTFTNWTGQDMTLESSLNSDDVGLMNQGNLHIDEGPGFATVDRFQQFSAGTLNIQVGGYAVGTNFDRLYASDGPAQLDGTLAIDLVDLDGSGAAFAPVVGDTFLILSASAGGVSGTFDNDPVSTSDGLTYEWTIIYAPTSVSIRLDNIIHPCPADFDGDGFVTGLDFDLYVAAFEAGDMAADFDEDGFITGLDFDAFVQAFEDGC